MLLTRLLLASSPTFDACVDEGLSPECHARYERAERRSGELQARKHLVWSLTRGEHHDAASAQADLLMDVPGADIWALSAAADAWYGAREWQKAAEAYDTLGVELAWHAQFSESARARAVIAWSQLDDPTAYDAAVAALVTLGD